jgi:hypothetical protein
MSDLPPEVRRHARIPFLPEKSLAGIASIAFTYLVISVPFVLSGICVCLALTRFPQNVGRLYAADLSGAAVGCVVLLYSLDVTDPAGVVLFVALGGLLLLLRSPACVSVSQTGKPLAV